MLSFRMFDYDVVSCDESAKVESIEISNYLLHKINELFINFYIYLTNKVCAFFLQKDKVSWYTYAHWVRWIILSV